MQPPAAVVASAARPVVVLSAALPAVLYMRLLEPVLPAAHCGDLWAPHTGPCSRVQQPQQDKQQHTCGVDKHIMAVQHTAKAQGGEQLESKGTQALIIAQTQPQPYVMSQLYTDTVRPGVSHRPPSTLSHFRHPPQRTQQLPGRLAIAVHPAVSSSKVEFNTVPR